MKKNMFSISIGLIIISIGVVILGNNFDFWDFNLFFDGWWSLFIIIPCIAGLFKKEMITQSVVGIIFGVLILLCAQDIFDWNIIWSIFIPCLIVIIGLCFIFQPNIKKIIKKDNNLKDYVGIFSGCEENINGEFSSCKCIAVFGGVDLDLRDAKLSEETVIDCYCIFGGIDIKVPDNAIVKTNGFPIFGGLDNKVRLTSNNSTVTININYVCAFGGIDIK